MDAMASQGGGAGSLHFFSSLAMGGANVRFHFLPTLQTAETTTRERERESGEKNGNEMRWGLPTTYVQGTMILVMILDEDAVLPACKKMD